MAWLSRTQPSGEPRAWTEELLHDSALLQNGGCVAEYVWLTRLPLSDGNPGSTLRSKTRVLPNTPQSCAQVPSWSADGLSTNQADAEGGRLTYLQEIVLLPVRLIRDPFRGAPNVIVLCEACFPPPQGAQQTQQQQSSAPAGESSGSSGSAPAAAPSMSAPISNTRRKALNAGLAAGGDWLEGNLWMAFEQELVLLGDDWTRRQPLGWPSSTTQPSSKPSLNYCGVGAEAVGRDVLEAIQAAALYAGLTITGSNLEVLSGALELQVGPSPALQAADDLWLARYLATRVAGELFGLRVSFAAKPIEDDEGLGLHANVSTASMRGEAGRGGGGGGGGQPSLLSFGVHASGGPLGPSQLQQGAVPPVPPAAAPAAAPAPPFVPLQQAAHEAAAEGKPEGSDDTRQELLPGPPGQLPPAAATHTSPPVPAGLAAGEGPSCTTGMAGGAPAPAPAPAAPTERGPSAGHAGGTPSTQVPPTWNAVLDTIARLVATHRRHIAVYGPGNEARLVGAQEYSSLERCTWGVGDRSASIRVPFTTARGSGLAYIEDRRPAANADPYLIVEAYLTTLALDKGPSLEEAKRLLVGARSESWVAAQAMAASPTPTPPEVLSPEAESPRRGGGAGGGGNGAPPPMVYMPYGFQPFEFLHVQGAGGGGGGGGGGGEGGGGEGVSGGPPPRGVLPPPYPTSYMMASWPIPAPAPFYGAPYLHYGAAAGGGGGGVPVGGAWPPQSPGEATSQGGGGGGQQPGGWQQAGMPSLPPVFIGGRVPLRRAGAWMARAPAWSPHAGAAPAPAKPEASGAGGEARKGEA